MKTEFLSVGILCCGKVRTHLQQLAFLGYRIKWHEGSGWISRIFTITADERAYAALGSLARGLTVPHARTYSAGNITSTVQTVTAP